jgi:hypothetical protein
MIAEHKMTIGKLDLAMDAVNGVAKLVPVGHLTWKYVYSDGSVLIAAPWERYVGLSADGDCACPMGRQKHYSECKENRD